MAAPPEFDAAVALVFCRPVADAFGAMELAPGPELLVPVDEADLFCAEAIAVIPEPNCLPAG